MSSTAMWTSSKSFGKTVHRYVHQSDPTRSESSSSSIPPLVTLANADGHDEAVTSNRGPDEDAVIRDRWLPLAAAFTFPSGVAALVWPRLNGDLRTVASLLFLALFITVLLPAGLSLRWAGDLCSGPRWEPSGQH